MSQPVVQDGLIDDKEERATEFYHLQRVNARVVNSMGIYGTFKQNTGLELCIQQEKPKSYFFYIRQC